jgi:DAK2 domain fusion protein YloV
MQVAESRVTGLELKEAYEQAALYLEDHIEELNAMNIFPVPDGDTGINMFLTMKSAVAAMNKSPDMTVAGISSTAARGALLGARGNSGVILSQILKGIAKGLEGKVTFSFRDFTAALHVASEQAYRTVANPVEGTILTVIREVSEAASRIGRRRTSFARMIMSVTLHAKKTVKRTPEMLPVLKEAGVVDSGAKGLFYVLEGMKDSICRKRIPVKTEVNSVQEATGKMEEKMYGFDVQFMIQGEDLPVEEIREKVTACGECPLVVGDNTLVRVHVHTMDPDGILDYAHSTGNLLDVVIEDMDQQVQQKNRDK